MVYGTLRVLLRDISIVSEQRARGSAASVAKVVSIRRQSTPDWMPLEQKEQTDHYLINMATNAQAFPMEIEVC